ncbi:uncharacterized protein LOC120167924 isoform X2 [Hibiscus syriacus]|uniref:uncharacterized protein LOC120167924 isoform X2 n=1 Tax=Hibiscus syriacus TaxID=106335 RepID=UPI001923F31A|nr:uncharacterized protein LOC120167924 isoform X2 [Hibiscus syriacus]
MAALRKPLLFLLLLPLIFSQITSQPSPGTVEVDSSDFGDAALKHKLDLLKSKSLALESTIAERMHEPRNNDESIREMETTIQDKSDSMQSSENEIEYLQRKTSPDSMKQMSNLHARAIELEKQVDNLKQKLEDVHGEWLPHWLAVLMYKFQSCLASHWNEHGRPALDITIIKALEKKDQLKSWTEPQSRTGNLHLIPMMKDGLPKVLNIFRWLLSKTIDVYGASKTFLTPHLVKACTVTYHYIQVNQHQGHTYFANF